MTDDPFATLGLDRRFDLDETELRQRFLSASAQAHPDRFTDPLDQADAVEAMSRLTDAHRELADPESRARALLRLSGLESDGDRDKLPPDLLMQVMEVREELEAAVEENDQGALERLRAWAHDERGQRLSALAGHFANTLDADSAAAVRLELNALRYVQRMLEQMPGQ